MSFKEREQHQLLTSYFKLPYANYIRCFLFCQSPVSDRSDLSNKNVHQQYQFMAYNPLHCVLSEALEGGLRAESGNRNVQNVSSSGCFFQAAFWLKRFLLLQP